MATESLVSSAEPVRLDSENPWPGLLPYDEASRDFFHGRDMEAAEFVRLIRLAPLTILYGKSGLGKTSLLQAGLFPSLRAQHFLPVYWRPQLSAGAMDHRLDEIAQRLIQEIDSAGAECPARAEDEGLWEYLHRNDFKIWSSDNFPLVPVLVLDQFEELFSRAGGGNAERIQQEFDSLADLIENRIPGELASDAATLRRSRLDLLSQRYRIVLSFREDYLPDVKTWEKKAPSLLRNYLRLEPMNRQCAIAAVEQVGKAVLDEDVAPLIVDFVGNVATGALPTVVVATAIEPVLLSLCCYQLNLRRLETSGRQIDKNLVTTAGQDILADFYREALEDEDVKGPPDVSRFIEDHLVQGERFRGAYSRVEALDQGFVTEKQLACLTGRRRLLRVVQYEDTDRIELIHDRLVSVVCKARDERREKEQRAVLEQKASEAEARAREKEENNRRLIRWRKGLVGALAVCTVALALCVAVMVYAWHQQRRAMAYAAIGGSYQNLRSKPELSMLLALQAMSLGKSAAAEALPRAENVLRRALNRPIQFSLLHTKKVNAVAFSPDGQTLAAASGTDVQLWNPQTGQKWREPMQHPSAVEDLAFTADGIRLVSGDAEGNVKVWDTQTGEENTPHPMQHGAPISSLALRPDNLLVTGNLKEDGSVILWNIATGEKIGILPMGKDTQRGVSDLAFSPDGTRLVVGDVNMGVTTLWDLRGLPNMEAVVPVMSLPNWKPGKEVTDERTRMLVNSVAFSHNGKWLATGDRYNAAQLWDADSGSHRRFFLDHTEPVRKVAFSPDDSRLATGGADGSVTIWDTATGRSLLSLDGHNLEILDLAFSPDGSRLATASRDKTVKTWNVATHGDAVNTVAFSPDGKLLATGSSDTTIKIWKTESRELVDTLVGHEDRVPDLAFSPNGQFLASVSYDKTTRIWDVATGKEAKPPSSLQYSDAQKGNDKFYQVAYSPDGRWLAAAGANYNAVVWDATTGALRFAGRHDDQVSAVAFKPDGKQLVSVGWDGMVKIWEIPSGNPVTSFESPDKSKLVDVKFDPTDGRLIMATGTPKVVVMDVATGQKEALVFGDKPILTAQFTPYGKQILTRDTDSRVRIWDATTHQEIKSFPMLEKVNAVTVSRDGYWVATASRDGTLTVSPFNSDDLFAMGCRRVSRNLTDEECSELLGVDKCPPSPCDRLHP